MVSGSDKEDINPQRMDFGGQIVMIARGARRTNSVTLSIFVYHAVYIMDGNNFAIKLMVNHHMKVSKVSTKEETSDRPCVSSQKMNLFHRKSLGYQSNDSSWVINDIAFISMMAL